MDTTDSTFAPLTVDQRARLEGELGHHCQTFALRLLVPLLGGEAPWHVHANVKEQDGATKLSIVALVGNRVAHVSLEADGRTPSKESAVSWSLHELSEVALSQVAWSDADALGEVPPTPTALRWVARCGSARPGVVLSEPEAVQRLLTILDNRIFPNNSGPAAAEPVRRAVSRDE